LKQAYRYGLSRINIAKEEIKSKIEEIDERIDSYKIEVDKRSTTKDELILILEDFKNTENDFRVELKNESRLTAKQVQDFKGEGTFWDKHTGRILASMISGVFGLGTGSFITWLAFFLKK